MWLPPKSPQEPGLPHVKASETQRHESIDQLGVLFGTIITLIRLHCQWSSKLHADCNLSMRPSAKLAEKRWRRMVRIKEHTSKLPASSDKIPCLCRCMFCRLQHDIGMHEVMLSCISGVWYFTAFHVLVSILVSYGNIPVPNMRRNIHTAFHYLLLSKIWRALRI